MRASAQQWVARCLVVATCLVTFCVTGPEEHKCEDWWVVYPGSPDTVRTHLCEPVSVQTPALLRQVSS
jgi:hypothetical protein